MTDTSAEPRWHREPYEFRDILKHSTTRKKQITSLLKVLKFSSCYHFVDIFTWSSLTLFLLAITFANVRENRRRDDTLIETADSHFRINHAKAENPCNESSTKEVNQMLMIFDIKPNTFSNNVAFREIRKGPWCELVQYTYAKTNVTAVRIWEFAWY